jgi:peptidoglycan/xylan/chitin deacetylase (PgdA/CDA1 family)
MFKAVLSAPNNGLRVAKNFTLMGARTCGVYAAFRRSRWRAQRLLILGYHGISLHDEHLWRPGLFMTPDLFTRRLDTIAKMGYTVLSLDEATNRLRTQTLPPMSVVITFDDGFYNFFSAAYPILKRFGYPATVYQTTYYSFWNKPIFNLLCHYLFWKASGKMIEAQPIIGRPGTFDLRTQKGIDAASLEVHSFARSAGLSPQAKQQLAKTLADSVGVDYEEISKKRLFHVMNKNELSQLIRQGVDIQLHTHRHRVPASKELFLKELSDNLSFLKEVGQPEAKHFTYPSGVYREQLFPWLHEFGVRSATTCETGLVSWRSNPMCLPRLIDTTQISGLEFESWLCGLREFLPGRANGRARRTF